MRLRAVEVKPLEDYLLEITFDNGKKGVFDVKPYLEYVQFKQIKDEKIFKTVKIDGLSISWDNGVDICPDELYNGIVVKN